MNASGPSDADSAADSAADSPRARNSGVDRVPDAEDLRGGDLSGLRRTPARGSKAILRITVPPVRVSRLTPQQKADVLVEEYLVAAAEDAKNVPPPLPPPARGLLKAVLAAGLVVGCVGVWLVAVYSPRATRTGLPTCPDQRNAVMRLRLVEQAQAIETYLDKFDRLPPNLAATGDSLVGVTYIPKKGDDYELVVHDRDLLVSYSSRKPLDEFVGDAVSVLSRKCK
jgi:hypothetical protein